MLFLVAQTFFLLVVATVIGVAAGWLIWGGPNRQTAGSAATAEQVATLTGELERSQADVDARSADVARLRRKLKRAVEELERHATQLEAAEEQIASLASGETGVVGSSFANTAQFDAELATLRNRLSETEVAHAQVDAELQRQRVDHGAVSDQLRFAQARSEALENELASVRQITSAEGSRSADVSRRSDELEAELQDAQSVIRDATARVTYLEQQALLWQNEADRLQVVLDEGAASQHHQLDELHQQINDLRREHEAAAGVLRIEASSNRLKADAAAEQLARLQAEFRTVQERSHALLEANRVAMADIDRQLSAAHSTLNDATPKPFAVEVEVEVPESEGLEALPGITPELLDHLNELGVSSLADVARWTPDDVARIAAWLPENPGVITSNNWVESARELLSSQSVASAPNEA